MARPKLHSDSDILDTALRVLLQKGPHAFTLSDVASAIGMSRAALIQRFGDKQALHRKVMERATGEVRDYFASLDATRGLAPLWAMLKDLIGGMGSGEGVEGYLLLLWGDTRDDGLRALAAERNRLVRDAITARLPLEPHAPGSTAGLIQSVLQGACMRWFVEREGELAGYMTAATRGLMELLYPAHPFD